MPTLEELIQTLEEQQKTASPEKILEEKLAEDHTPPTSTDEVVEVLETEKEETLTENTEDLLKHAEEFVEQGRLMAIGFVEELKKLASAEEEVQPEDTEKTAEQILTNLYTKYFGEK